MNSADTLQKLAARIDDDEDFAMRVGEDARATLEAAGLDDETIAAVINEAEADVVGFALPHDAVALQVGRIHQALLQVAAD